MSTETAILLCITAIVMMTLILVSNAGIDIMRRRRRKK